MFSISHRFASTSQEARDALRYKSHNHLHFEDACAIWMFEGEYVSDSEDDAPMVIPILLHKSTPREEPTLSVSVPSPDTSISTLSLQAPIEEAQAEPVSEPVREPVRELASEPAEPAPEPAEPAPEPAEPAPEPAEPAPEPAEPAPELASTEPSVPKRVLRRRRVNQLRPYAYDTLKYGNISYDYRTSSSPDFHQDPQQDSYGTDYQFDAQSSPPERDSLEVEAEVSEEEIFERSSSPSRENMGTVKPLALHSQRANTVLREINSSDDERIAFVPKPRKPEFINSNKSQSEQGDPHDGLSDSHSEESNYESDSEESMMEGPLQLDFMMSGKVQGHSAKRTNVTDFMRIAARTIRNIQQKQKRTSTPTENTTTKAHRATSATRKIIRHERSRQTRISTHLKASKQGMVNKTMQNSPKRVITSKPTGNGMQAYGVLPATARAQAGPANAGPANNPSMKRKRKEALQLMAHSRRHPNAPKRARAVPQPRDIYFTPIYEQEAFISAPTIEHDVDHTRYEEWELEAQHPVSRLQSNTHTFWYPKLPTKARLPLYTFVGSNTLSLLDVPQPWNGQSGHTQIAGIVETHNIGKTMDLHREQLIDDDILESTYTDMYDYYFQLAADLMRPDALLDYELREYILIKSSKTLSRILEQIDSPPVTIRARLMFGIFALCAGYSGSQVGLVTEYDEIKDKVFSLVVKYIKATGKTLAMDPPYDRSFVAAELLLAMHRLGVWTPQSQAFDGHSELKWQLIFITAWVHKFESQEYSGWPIVQSLLNSQHLDNVDRKNYINRCVSLLTVWNWPVDKEITQRFFEYYDRHKEYSGSEKLVRDIPKMVTGAFKGQIHDTEWEAFLELLGLSIKSSSNDPEFIQFRDKLVPSSTWISPKQGKLEWEQISSVCQRLSITLTLFNASPPDTRLSIERVLDVVQVQDSHLSARVRCLRAWWVIAMEAVRPSDMKACAAWFSRLTKYTFEQLRLSLKSTEQDPTYDIPFTAFYEELYTMILEVPMGPDYYTPHMLAPLNFQPSPKMKQCLWQVIMRLPTTTLYDCYPVIKKYFRRNSDPIRVWIQVLIHAKENDLEWPHPNKPAFLTAVIKARPIPLSGVVRPALEFASRHTWAHGEQQFFDALETVYHINLGGKREEVVRMLLDSQEDARYLLQELEKNSKSSELDQFERLIYEGVCYRMRSICFQKFPQLSKRYSYQMSPGDEMNDSFLGNIKSKNWIGFQHYVSHKIAVALKHDQFNTFISEILPCLQHLDENNQPDGFDALVNGVFASYVKMAMRRSQMGKFIIIFAQITLKAIEFSDTIKYNPLPFLQSLAAYIVSVLNARQFVDWRVISVFMQICSSCVRKLYISDSDQAAQSIWSEALPKFVELARAAETYKAGNLSVTLPAFTSDAQPVPEDFLRLAKDPVIRDANCMDANQAIRLFLKNYDCFRGTTVLL